MAIALEDSGARADDCSVRARLRSEQGFGMIELLISVGILNVALLAIFAAFNSGALALARASQTSTASVLADKQMELYRAITFTNVALDSSAVTTAGSDATYTGDPAFSATQSTKTCTGLPAECNPRQTVTGPDGRSYRLDTFIVSETPPNGRAVKRVTVAVRKSGATASLARLTSTFDASTGS
jgi:Tfp pilus assembly protein PilV